MTTRGRLGTALLLACAVALAGGFILGPRPPGIVSELRSLPQVALVHFSGPANAKLIVVHIRDWHLVPEELAEIEGLDYPALSNDVEKVQADQLAIARFLIRRHGVRAVYSEGLSKDSMSGLTARVDLLRDIDKLASLRKLDAGELAQQREFTLTVGVAGRLLLAGEIADVLPLEDEAALQNAKPVADGKISPNEAKIQARRRAIVKNLPASGLAVVILGGSHDLGPHLPASAAYVSVTPRRYPE